MLLRLIFLARVLVLIGSLLSISSGLICSIFFALSFYEKSKRGDLLQVFIVLGLPVFGVQLPRLENELRIEGNIAFSYEL